MENMTVTPTIGEARFYSLPSRFVVPPTIEETRFAPLHVRCVYTLRKMKQSITNLVALNVLPEVMKVYDVYEEIRHKRMSHQIETYRKTGRETQARIFMDTRPDGGHYFFLLHTIKKYHCERCHLKYELQCMEYTKQEICRHLETFLKTCLSPNLSLYADKHYVLKDV